MHKRLVFTLVLAMGLPTGAARAAFIDIAGAAGADGAAGAPGDPGQPGGDGGPGEPVTYDFNGPTTDYFNDANATGGAGGAGGAGGDGVPAGAPSGSGGAGGAGGATTTTLSVESALRTFTEAIANGGAGGAGAAPGAASGGGLTGSPGPGGAGGDATAVAISISTGDAQDSLGQAIATGGAGGSSLGVGGAGGAAFAHAGAYSLNDQADAHASQIGGAGGSGEIAAGTGHDSFLANVVTGDTGGGLELSQYAEGGAGGTGPGSRGGDARSVLTYERDTGLYGLSLGSSAQGGAASSPDASNPARGGDATAIVEGRDHLGHFLEVSGFARGGAATGPNSQVGSSTVSVHGVSTAGGTISAYGQALGGGGTTGGSVDLFNAVTAETTGEVYLFQSAGGGYGSERTGSASSRLDVSGSFTSLSLRTDASGGGTFENEPAGTDAVSDAFGFAESIAHNTSGSASAEANGYGGYAPTYPYPTSSDGGDAEAHASATTEGDGHDAASEAHAYGGSLYGDGAHRGGDALATATSVALGDSAAGAYSTASAGGAGSGDGALLRSGWARAESMAVSAGSGRVSAEAAAYSDSPFDFVAASLLASEARSTATGNGEVIAHATALGAVDSDAHATAHSSGPVIGADAHVTQLVDHTVLTALAAQAGFRKTYFEGNADFYTEEGYDSLGYVNALPVEGEAQAWTADNPNVAGALGSGDPLAVGLVRANDGVAADFSLTLDTGALSAGDVLSIGFVDLKLPASGFGEIRIELAFAGTVSTLQYDGSAQALEGLSDDLVSFAVTSVPSGPLSFDIRYWIAMLPGSEPGEIAFDSRFIVFAQHVPEPSIAWLVGAGLAALAAVTRASAARAAR